MLRRERECSQVNLQSSITRLDQAIAPIDKTTTINSLRGLELLKPSDFTSEPLSEAVSLTKEGLHTFLRLYEQKKQSEFKHPVLGRKCTYQEAFEIQARLLAKYLMGEIDKYPPLVLK